MSFDAERRWQLNPRVALRPEPFGALAYHFGTRRLSFLKSNELRDLVLALGDHPTAAAAMEARGIPAGERDRYGDALATLAGNGMITEPPVAATAGASA